MKMREILFRGKRIDTGKWVYGYYYSECGNTIIIENRQVENMLNRNTPYQVIPNTVGQYTGLQDSKGFQIFEGDIIRIAGVNNLFTVIYEIIKDDEFSDGTQSSVFSLEAFTGERTFFIRSSKMEVVGTIHDNHDDSEKIDGELRG